MYQSVTQGYSFLISKVCSIYLKSKKTEYRCYDFNFNPLNNNKSRAYESVYDWNKDESGPIQF